MRGLDSAVSMDALQAEWEGVEAGSNSWQQELKLAGAVLDQLDTALVGLTTRLLQFEEEIAEWAVPPPLDAAPNARGQLETLQTALGRAEQAALGVRQAAEAAPAVAGPALARLAGLEQRLTQIQEAVGARESQLAALETEPDPGSQLHLQAALPPGWERRISESGAPFYTCHSDQATQWDHPELESLLAGLASLNTVKFSAYRLALKLRRVQQKLCLDLLDITSAVVCFDSHGLTGEKDDLTIQVADMVVLLTSIYETLGQCEPEEISVPLCTDLALNWILNLFDPGRTGCTRVLSFKLGLVLLCRGPLSEKYEIMFQLAAGEQNSSLDSRSLGLLLYDLVMVPRYLGEVAQFGGSNIEPSVRSCLAGRPGVTSQQFCAWLEAEPQSLVWLPVLHRLASAETATHGVRCRICKTYPIVGFRYHCRKCFNLDICHACFFLGKSYKGHKAEHPMQEYCTSTSRTDNARHLLQAVRNSFRTKRYFKRKQAKLAYLPVQSVLEGETFECSPALSPNLSLESREFEVTGSLTGAGEAVTEEDEHSLIASYCRQLGGNTETILQEVKYRGQTIYTGV